MRRQEDTESGARASHTHENTDTVPTSQPRTTHSDVQHHCVEVAVGQFRHRVSKCSHKTRVTVTASKRTKHGNATFVTAVEVTPRQPSWTPCLTNAMCMHASSATLRIAAPTTPPTMSFRTWTADQASIQTQPGINPGNGSAGEVPAHGPDALLHPATRTCCATGHRQATYHGRYIHINGGRSTIVYPKEHLLDVLSLQTVGVQPR